MFDVGFWEIAIIAVIALMVLGPERLPRAARTAGLWVGKARRTLAEVKRDIDRELDAADLKDIKDIKDDLKDIEGEMSDTKTVFQDAAKTMNETVGDEEKFTIMPDGKEKAASGEESAPEQAQSPAEEPESAQPAGESAQPQAAEEAPAESSKQPADAEKSTVS